MKLLLAALVVAGLVGGCQRADDGTEFKVRPNLSWICVAGHVYLPSGFFLNHIGAPIFDDDGKPMPCTKWREMQKRPEPK